MEEEEEEFLLFFEKKVKIYIHSVFYSYNYYYQLTGLLSKKEKKEFIVRISFFSFFKMHVSNFERMLRL